MSATAIPKRHVTMVLVKRLGSKITERMPYNILRWGGVGRPYRYFLEPAGPLLKTHTTVEKFDAVSTYSDPPFVKSGVN